MNQNKRGHLSEMASLALPDLQKGLLLELGHEYDNERKYKCQEHGAYDAPGNYLFCYILSVSAAHFLFPPLKRRY